MLLVHTHSCPERLVAPLLLSMIPWVFPACVSLSATSPASFRCPPTVRKLITADGNTIRIAYKEPTNQSNGIPLRTLSHTTIYYDVGHGTFEYTKQSATSVRGGGEVEREITIPVDPGKVLEVRVCVTATNSAREGAPTP
jgi:hypothetical protein